MPYVTIPAGSAIGKTVDGKINAAPAKVTLLSARTLRIEPDDVCTIISAITQDGQTTLCAISGRKRAINLRQ